MDGRKALAARDEWSPTADVFRSMHVSSLRSWLVINCNGRAKKLRLGQDCEKCALAGKKEVGPCASLGSRIAQLGLSPRWRAKDLDRNLAHALKKRGGILRMPPLLILHHTPVT
jgi:hypothetical protein